MLTYNTAFYRIKQQLQPLYDEREAAAISHEILEHITHCNKTERLFKKDTEFTAVQQQHFEDATDELLKGKPLQYVTGVAWFMGREYSVNMDVLIPRPETEELVQWVIHDWQKTTGQLRILDIGTGSGCIPVSLKLKLPEAHVTSCDISSIALETAKKNSTKLNASVDFIQMDFLEPAEQNKLDSFNVIVSNPPYIPLREKGKLHVNVTEYEPHIALFVPDSDALLFYRNIAAFGKHHIQDGGAVYCELDAEHVMECKELFEGMGYKSVVIKKDMNNNWRMIRAMIN